jgi:hypothetical protein
VRVRPAAAGAALGLFAWWATGLRPFTGTAYLVVVGAGVSAMAWGARRHRPPVRAWPAGNLLVWAVLAVVLALWQIAAFVQHPRPLHPTLSYLANIALEPRPVRALALVLWLVVAARLARRPPRESAGQ